MPVQNIRQAHNVLATIAHKALLNGDDRQVVYEANTMLFEFIKAHDPDGAPATPVTIKADAAVGEAIEAAKTAITAKPTARAKGKAFAPPKLDHSKIPTPGRGAEAPKPPNGIARKPKP